MTAKKVVELNKYMTEADNKEIVEEMQKAGYKILKETGSEWVWIEK